MRFDVKEKAIEVGLKSLAFLSLAVLAGIVFYLFREGLPVFANLGLLDFVFGTDWYPVGDSPDFEIGSLIAGSLAVTFLASLFAVPLGLMSAACLSEVVANTTRRIIKPFIELLAALPWSCSASSAWFWWRPGCRTRSESPRGSIFSTPP